jgi:hypothetical protein
MFVWKSVTDTSYSCDIIFLDESNVYDKWSLALSPFAIEISKNGDLPGLSDRQLPFEGFNSRLAKNGADDNTFKEIPKNREFLKGKTE